MLSARILRLGRPRALVAPQLGGFRASQGLGRRFYSTEDGKKTSPHVGFYKTFGRPIAKGLLVAMLTYQIIYLIWTKLEMEEMKTIKKEEILKLEGQVKELQEKKM